MVKSFTLFAMGALLLAGSAVAAPKVQQSLLSQMPTQAQMKDKMESKKKMLESHKSERTQLSTRAIPEDNPVYEVPGTPKIYSANVEGYDWGAPYEDPEIAYNIVFDENGKVYIQDIIPYWGLGSYIEGEIDNNTITVALPQITDYYVGYWGMALVVLENAGVDEYEYASDINSVEFTYDSETGEIELNLPGEPGDYLLGYVYTDDESWTGDGLTSFNAVPFQGNIVSMPEGIEPEQYSFTDGEYSHFVNIANDGENLYIQGLSATLPDGVVMAYLNDDGTQAFIPQDQIVGTLYGYFIQTKVFMLNEKGTAFVLAPETMDYPLVIDAENKVIVPAVDVENITTTTPIFALNASATEPYPLEYYVYFMLYVTDNYAGTPADPYDLGWEEPDIDWGSPGVFFFNIPNVSDEGLMLLSDDLYYRIYIDGEEYTFEYDEEDEMYPGVGEDGMLDIPFNFTNWTDILPGSNSPIERGIYIYFEGFETIGVQSVYKYGGETTYSAILTYNIVTDQVTNAIDSTIADSIIVNETYYDLSGRKVTNPSNGIFVKKATLENGKVVTSKVLKR